ncbi:hypothetical protein H4R33_000578 [Dimargaris cristalligena]|nr:hypothetical protein H4R33_000578 [Dimargaris cristalligena]
MIGSTALILGALVTSVAGHIFLETPCVRGSTIASCKYPNPDPNYLSAPIGSGGVKAFPLCHYTEAYASPVAIYKAGGSASVKFSSTGAAHNGGHCQFSLSYDKGKTFTAIHTIMNSCPTLGGSLSVPIPSNAPSAAMAIFAWTWVNKSGNREFYMNCADVKIEGKAGGSLSGPKIVIANYPGGVTIGEFLSGTNDGSEYYPGGSSSGSKTPTISAPEETEEAPAKPTTTKPGKGTKNPATPADDKDKDTTATTPEEPTTSTKPSTTSGESAGPACKSAGKSADIVVKHLGKDVITSCAKGMVCNNTNGVGAFCDIPKKGAA